MARKKPLVKHQSENQVKGRWGELIAAFAFPEHWVVRPLSHDFGIDLQVEVFVPADVDDDDDRAPRYRATGGHVACQVKTTEEVTVTKDSVVFDADTSDLRLAESMGASAPLLLLLVDRSTRLVHYVCLTDYVRVLNRKNAAWRTQGSHRLTLPIQNQLDLDDSESLEGHWAYFMNLAFRAKLYSISASFVYVERELEYALDRLQNSDAFDRERYASEFERTALAYQEALDACDAAIAQELGAADSPYAGLFGSVSRWSEQARPQLEKAMTLFHAVDPEAVDIGELEAQHLAVTHEIWLGASSFGSVAAIPRTYEQVIRSTRIPSGT